jgi:hypothetical protein
MTTTKRETPAFLVQAAISDKTAKYVNAEDIEVGIATVATVQNVEERKNINGVWISTGRTITRATIYFDDGRFTRTKSKHVIAAIGQLADEPVNIDNGFAVVINDTVRFGKEPTLYANGKMYDVLTMTVGEA